MVEKVTLIALCGIDCGECDAYQATKENDAAKLAEVAVKWSSEERKFDPEDVICDGCHGTRRFSWTEECDIRECGIDKGLTTCAQCEDYPCELLNNMWDMIGEEGSAAAKTNLEKLRS